MSARCTHFHNVSGERARELLFLYGSKGEFLVRPSESNINDHTISIHRGNRVTHVKIPLVDGVHRLPTGEEFTSLNDVVCHLVNTPNILSEKDGTFIEIIRPVQIPVVESIINIGFDRFFHMNIAGMDAEFLLQNEANGVYLVRESTSNPGEFAISAKNDNTLVHVRVYHSSDGKFRVLPKDNFRSLSDLLDNYVRHPMVQNGGSTVRLRVPLLSTRFTAASIDDRISCLLKGPYGKNVKDGFVDEYEKLHSERDSHLFISCKEGRKPDNVAKNRYRNVVPYDHTRIRLRLPTSDDRETDYINANKIVILSDPTYLEFRDFQRRYISTQGCLPETISDFWHMVWQEDARIIVMITKEVERGRVKCSRYWPEVESSCFFGPTNRKLEIFTVSEKTEGDYVKRKFRVTRDNETREIFHFQFLGWEDNGCPSDSILVFLEHVNGCLQCDVPDLARDGPVVVHCSAGIGRTGTFITLDIIVNRIKIHGPNCVVDIQKTVRMLREQRATMVQTEAQYRFIYYAISAFMKLQRERQQMLDCLGSASKDRIGSISLATPPPD